MLTPTDLKNIKNFDDLNKNHQRIFKFRLKGKCSRIFQDLDYLLLNYSKLKLKKEEIIDINRLISLIKTYEDLEKLEK